MGIETSDLFFFELGGGLPRRHWKEVSDRAKETLEEAKDVFRTHVKRYSWDMHNIPLEHSFTKTVIDFHVVSKLRPQFNRYVKQFGATPKWTPLSHEEKLQYKKYKNRKSAIYFCQITIDGFCRQKLLELEPQEFEKEDRIADVALFVILNQKYGVPEIDALGWLVELPGVLNESSLTEKKAQFKKLMQELNLKIPKLNEMNQVLTKLDNQDINTIPVDTIEEYKSNSKNFVTKKNKNKRKSSMKMNNNNNENNNETKKIKLKRTSFFKKPVLPKLESVTKEEEEEEEEGDGEGKRRKSQRLKKKKQEKLKKEKKYEEEEWEMGCCSDNDGGESISCTNKGCIKWFHNDCLMENYGYSKSRIESISFSEDVEWSCPDCSGIRKKKRKFQQLDENDLDEIESISEHDLYEPNSEDDRNDDDYVPTERPAKRRKLK